MLNSILNRRHFIGRTAIGTGAVIAGTTAIELLSTTRVWAAAEGTDGLLRRCAGLRRDGPGGVLVKVAKPGQERRADRPTIGPRTVALAAASGLRGIAAEAGMALVIDRAELVRVADEAGLFLIGVSAT